MTPVYTVDPPPAGWRGLVSTLRRLPSGKAFWLAAPGVLFLLVFLIYPSVQLLLLSLIDRSSGAISGGAFTRLVASPVYRQVLFNTFVIALQTTACCLLFGYPLAYWLSNLPSRRRNVVMLLILMAFWMSALVKNFAWLVLLGRNGFIASVFAYLGVAGGDKLLFHRSTVVFAMAHTLLPLAVVTILPVLGQIDRRLMSSASTLGAGRAQAFWRIYFPLSMRGVAAAGLLVFVSSLGFFITPMLLGSPREMMIGQLIIAQINEMQNWQFGSALALVLIVSALLSCYLYNLVFGLSSIAGAGSPRPRSPQGSRLRAYGLRLVARIGKAASQVGAMALHAAPWLARVRWLGIYAWLLIALLLLPMASIVPMAFTADDFLSFPPHGYSTRWFDVYFSSPLWISASLRSLCIALGVALLALVIASTSALAMRHAKGSGATVIFMAFLLPMIVPSIVIAIALFYLFTKVSLIATSTGIALGHTVMALPVVFVIVLTTLRGHNWSLDVAAATLGAKPWKVFRRITLPLIKGGLFAGFITGFLVSFEELTVALFIGGGLITTLPKQLWDDILLQVNPTLAAASVVVMATIVVLFLLAQSLRSKH